MVYSKNHDFLEYLLILQSSHNLVFDQKIGHKLYMEAVLVDFTDFQICELKEVDFIQRWQTWCYV